MSSICFKTEGPSSGRQLHVQIIPWYNTFINNYTIPVHTTTFLKIKKYKLYPNYTYNCLPEDESSGSKHVEDIVKIKISV